MLVKRSVRVVGPLAFMVEGFADDLAQRGYSVRSADAQKYLVAHLSRWLAAEGLDAGALRQTEVEGFLRARRTVGYTSHLSIKAMQPILGYLRKAGVLPTEPRLTPSGPVDATLARFHDYLTVERRLARSTVRSYVDAVRPFLQTRIVPDGLAVDLAQLTAGDVVSFVISHCARRRHGTAKVMVTALRSLLRFLHVDGAVQRSLDSAVPAVAERRLAGLPKGLEPGQVARLLAACDRSTVTGCRDIAILALLLRLGLRAVEVAALRLDDIDWRAGEIVLHGKGNVVERLPIPADVGDAVAAYLRRDRPATAQGRTVFVRIKAPHCALSPAGVTQMVAAVGERAGLGRLHAHRLRHTAATQMLRAGASLPEIGQILRHRRAMTTAIYAKVDHEALRTIAPSWPGDVA